MNFDPKKLAEEAAAKVGLNADMINEAKDKVGGMVDQLKNQGGGVTDSLKEKAAEALNKGAEALSGFAHKLKD